MRRLIIERHPDYQRAAILGDGGEPAQAMLLDVKRLRACADHLLSMAPIPVNYRSLHYWNGYPPSFMPWAMQAPVQAPAPAPVQAAPAVIVVNPPAQHQSVNVTPPGVSVAVPAGVTTGPTMQPYQALAPGMVQAFPGGAPIPDYPLQTAAPQSYPMHSPMPATVAPSAVQASPPTPSAATSPASAASNSDPAPPPDVWNATKEAGYLICKAATEGDVDAIARITPIASEYGVSVDEFCRNYAASRAFARNRHNEIHGAAA